MLYSKHTADPGGRGICGRLFAGIAGSNFSGHGCPSAVSVVCCQVEFPATDRSFVQWSPTECVCVIVCDQLQPSTPKLISQREVRLRKTEREKEYEDTASPARFYAT